MEGRKEDAFLGLLMWSVPTHSCMHLYSPQQHALYLSAQVSAVSQDLFSVCTNVSTLLSGTETLLYSSTSARGRHREAKLNYLGKTVQFLRFVRHSLLKRDVLLCGSFTELIRTEFERNKIKIAQTFIRNSFILKESDFFCLNKIIYIYIKANKIKNSLCTFANNNL